MRQIRHTIGRLATTWWLLVCLCAPHLAAMVPAEEAGHACCRKKSTCCCRNRTGKASAIIGDRAECSRTCGIAAVGVKLAAAAIAPLSFEFGFRLSMERIHEERGSALRSPLAAVLHQRPPPAFSIQPH